MTDEALIEELALVLVKRDQERFDLPRIETIEDFRFESDAAEYIANARAILPIIQRERLAAGEAVKCEAKEVIITGLGLTNTRMLEKIRALNVEAIVGGGE